MGLCKGKSGGCVGVSIVVLMCISLMRTNAVENLFKCMLTGYLNHSDISCEVSYLLSIPVDLSALLLTF